MVRFSDGSGSELNVTYEKFLYEKLIRDKDIMVIGDGPSINEKPYMHRMFWWSDTMVGLTEIWDVPPACFESNEVQGWAKKWHQGCEYFEW